MGSAGALYIAVKGDTKDFIKALKGAQNVSVQSSKKMEKSFQNVSNAVSQLRTAVAALGGAWALRELTRVSDAYTLLDSKLRLVTGSTKEAQKTFNRLFEIAQDTGVSFRNVADTFVNMQLNMRDVGVSVEETTEFLDIWNKSLIINGSTQREAAASTLQLKQAMSSGRLAGEEFRGVSEGNAYWMTQLAAATGMTVGELRTLSHQQKLTREFILDATGDMAAGIRRDFGGITKTLERSFNELKNVLEALFRDIKDTGDAAENLAHSISSIAEAISRNRSVFAEFFGDQVGEFISFFGDFGDGNQDIQTTIDTLGRLFETILKLREIKEELGVPKNAKMGVLGHILYGGEAGLALLNEAADTVHEKVTRFIQSKFPEKFIDGLDQASHLTYGIADQLEAVSHIRLDEIGKIELGSHFEDIKGVSDSIELTAKNARVYKEAVEQPLGEDTWLIQAGDAAKVGERAHKQLEEQAKKAKEALDKSAEYAQKLHILTSEQLPRDSWLVQMKDAPDVLERAEKALADLNDEKNQLIDQDLEDFFGPIDEATEEWRKNQEESLESIEVLYEQFVRNVGSEFETLFKGVLTGELNTFEDVFESFGDALLEIWIDLMAKMAAQWFLDKLLNLGSAAGFGNLFSSIFGGAGAGAGGGAAAAGGGGLVGAIAAKLGFGGAGAGAAGVSGPGYVMGTGAGSFGTYGATSGTISGSAGQSTLGGSAGADLLGTGGMSGIMAPAAAVAAFMMIGSGGGPMQALAGYDPKLEEFLNEKLVTPFQIAAEGVSDEFTAISDTMAGSLVPELTKFDAISVDAASGVMLLGNNMFGVSSAGGELNNVFGAQIQIFDEASGTWKDAGVSMTDLVAEVDRLVGSTGQSVSAIADLVAEEAGLISISDELEQSYYSQVAAMRELSGVSSQATVAIKAAGGALHNINWGAIPSDQHADVRRELKSYAVGSDFIERDQLAFLHKGEAVLTKEQNEARKQPTQITIPVSVGGQHLKTIVVDIADKHIVSREERGITGRVYT